MKLKGRIALVTGAASGIGRAIAELFAQEGARVIAVDQDKKGLELVGLEIQQKGGQVWEVPCDVTNANAASQTVADVKAKWGSITILVTSAGISIGKTASTTSEQEWDHVFAVNVKGVYLWLHHVLPEMVEAGGGAVVTIASQLAMAGSRDCASYAASKGAVISLTRSVALDYATHGIRANTILPGAVNTPLLERSFQRKPNPALARENSKNRHPLGRFGNVAEVARAALYLASDDSSFTTGVQLPVDGGFLVN